MKDRELDVAIAKQLFGFDDDLISLEGSKPFTKLSATGTVSELPQYSQDISAAFSILQRIVDLETPSLWYWKIELRPLGYEVKIWKSSAEKHWTAGDIVQAEATNTALPRAICEAANWPVHRKAGIWIERVRLTRLEIGVQTMTHEQQEQRTERELDAEVAEKVMGWKRSTNDGFASNDIWVDAADYGLMCGVGEFQPSTSIKAAFDVVEKMREKYLFKCENHIASWTAQFWNTQRWQPECKATDASLPRAICLAALRAVEGEK